MRALVTGDRGFLGVNLVNHLLNRSKMEVIGFSRRKEDKWNCPRYTHASVDLSDGEELSRAYNALGPFDFVFHLAANPLVRWTEQSVITDNVCTTDNLLRLVQPQTRLIFASSATVYGESLRHGRCQAFMTTEKPISLYGCTKLMGEKLVEFYGRANDFHYTICRLVANCGPWSTHGVVHDLIAKAKSDGDTLVVLGDDPGTIKPYASVTETVSLMHHIAKREYSDIVDISPRTSISVRRVAEIILEELGSSKKIEFTGNTWTGDDHLVQVNSNFRMMDSEENIRNAVKREAEGFSYRRFINDRDGGEAKV